MNTDPLNRFREGLAAGRFTMTQVAAASGIPLTTLSDMKDESWGTRITDRLNSLDAAIDQIEADGRRRNTKKRKGERATA